MQRLIFVCLKQNIKCRCNVFPADLKLTADPDLIDQVLINLVLKGYPRTITNKIQKRRLIKFLNVPLDHYTIVGLKNIATLKIPSNATMGFIVNRKRYLQFQNEIRKITTRAKVSPIYYDFVAWDKAHE